MIAFATSFRARALADDWPYHVWLLERVVYSMLAQTRADVSVVVACHDIPDTPLTKDARVHFLPVAVAVPNKNFDAMVGDKVLKLSAGARWAQQRGCDYVIFNDADDLVSNRLGGYVLDHAGEPGWYTTSQRFYTYGGRLMRRQQIASPNAGPCVIVRTDLLTFATPPFSGPWADLIVRGGEQHYLQLLANHGVEVNLLAAVGMSYYRDWMEARGCPLSPLPFPANVVINHGDSVSVSGGTHGYHVLTGLRSLRRSLRWVPTLEYASRAVRGEFAIPPDSEIPSNYRASGSVFWR